MNTRFGNSGVDGRAFRRNRSRRPRVPIVPRLAGPVNPVGKGWSVAFLAVVGHVPEGVSVQGAQLDGPFDILSAVRREDHAIWL